MAELIVTSLAEVDIATAFEWYEACCPGVGTRFVLGVDAVLAAVARKPQAFSVRDASHRMAMLDRFPYSIYFLFIPEREVVSVRRVLHFRRDIPKRI
jgi:plasmid stabilization system protein ParE